MFIVGNRLKVSGSTADFMKMDFVHQALDVAKWVLIKWMFFLMLGQWIVTYKIIFFLTKN